MPAGTELVLTTAVDALQEVLGTMFFSDAVQAACQHLAAGEWMSARVRFSGDPAGELRLMLSPGLAVVFAAGFLGIDEAEVTEEAASQVICELANMLCGAILSRLHPDSLVALGAPQLTSVDFDMGHGIHQCFAIPEGTLAIHLSSDAW
jgi:CheY-specific phosphatase CheX